MIKGVGISIDERVIILSSLDSQKDEVAERVKFWESKVNELSSCMDKDLIVTTEKREYFLKMLENLVDDLERLKGIKKLIDKLETV